MCVCHMICFPSVFKCLSTRRIPTSMRYSMRVLNFKKNMKYALCDYPTQLPFCLLLYTPVPRTPMSKTEHIVKIAKVFCVSPSHLSFDTIFWLIAVFCTINKTMKKNLIIPSKSYVDQSETILPFILLDFRQQCRQLRRYTFQHCVFCILCFRSECAFIARLLLCNLYE